MTGQKPSDESASTAKANGDAAASVPPQPTPVNAIPAAEEPVDVSKLTAEEQMARFEKELKENDWGHQPC